MDDLKLKTLEVIASYFDARKKGYAGNSGYRKTSELRILKDVSMELISKGIIVPEKTVFMDLGCGDGRVCMFMSYFCKCTVGIEIEDFIYDEYISTRLELEDLLRKENLLPIPSSLHVIHGDSLSEKTHDGVKQRVGITMTDVDIFYTYITMHDVFAEMIRNKARLGSYYMVYGFTGILPSYEGFILVDPDVSGRKRVALYRKIDGRQH